MIFCQRERTYMKHLVFEVIKCNFDNQRCFLKARKLWIDKQFDGLILLLDFN